jgi:hypothetical protein
MVSFVCGSFYSGENSEGYEIDVILIWFEGVVLMEYDGNVRFEY